MRLNLPQISEALKASNYTIPVRVRDPFSNDDGAWLEMKTAEDVDDLSWSLIAHAMQTEFEADAWISELMLTPLQPAEGSGDAELSSEEKQNLLKELSFVEECLGDDTEETEDAVPLVYPDSDFKTAPEGARIGRPVKKERGARSAGKASSRNSFAATITSSLQLHSGGNNSSQTKLRWLRRLLRGKLTRMKKECIEKMAKENLLIKKKEKKSLVCNLNGQEVCTHTSEESFSPINKRSTDDQSANVVSLTLPDYDRSGALVDQVAVDAMLPAAIQRILKPIPHLDKDEILRQLSQVHEYLIPNNANNRNKTASEASEEKPEPVLVRVSNSAVANKIASYFSLDRSVTPLSSQLMSTRQRAERVHRRLSSLLVCHPFLFIASKVTQITFSYAEAQKLLSETLLHYNQKKKLYQEHVDDFTKNFGGIGPLPKPPHNRFKSRLDEDKFLTSRVKDGFVADIDTQVGEATECDWLWEGVSSLKARWRVSKFQEGAATSDVERAEYRNSSTLDPKDLKNVILSSFERTTNEAFSESGESNPDDGVLYGDIQNSLQNYYASTDDVMETTVLLTMTKKYFEQGLITVDESGRMKLEKPQRKEMRKIIKKAIQAKKDFTSMSEQLVAKELLRGIQDNRRVQILGLRPLDATRTLYGDFKMFSKMFFENFKKLLLMTSRSDVFEQLSLTNEMSSEIVNKDKNGNEVFAPEMEAVFNKYISLHQTKGDAVNFGNKQEDVGKSPGELLVETERRKAREMTKSALKKIQAEEEGKEDEEEEKATRDKRRGKKTSSRRINDEL
eukprot:GDKJ01026437.1.p1 GENE.GDKJ01026437.1~~GDKJ01026437.1.p1  ORF type:complete len:892 (-),score=216.08 GDKJ01026437.1:41-2413(-)